MNRTTIKHTDVNGPRTEQTHGLSTNSNQSREQATGVTDNQTMSKAKKLQKPTKETELNIDKTQP